MLTTLFHSPEFYPQWMDFEKNALHFVHMSRESYRNSVFLDVRTQHLGDPIQKVNLDDVLQLYCAPKGDGGIGPTMGERSTSGN